MSTVCNWVRLTCIRKRDVRMRGYTLLHLSRETPGISTTFSARYYSYDAGLRIMRDVCEDQYVELEASKGKDRWFERFIG